MEHYLEIGSDGATARVVFRELAHSGNGYVRLRHAATKAQRDALLHIGAGELLRAGAARVFCGFLNDGVTKIPPTCGFLSFEQFYSHAHDVDALALDLVACSGAQDGSFSFEALSTQNAGRYMHAYNEAFAQVPNFTHCAQDSVDELLTGEGLSGELALYDGKIAGVLELSRAGDAASIDAVALLPAFRGKGLGRALLSAALARLGRQSVAKAELTVSTANPAAYALYLGEGFTKTKLHCRWFSLEMGG